MSVSGVWPQRQLSSGALVHPATWPLDTLETRLVSRDLLVCLPSYGPQVGPLTKRQDVDWEYAAHCGGIDWVLESSVSTLQRSERGRLQLTTILLQGDLPLVDLGGELQQRA